MWIIYILQGELLMKKPKNMWSFFGVTLLIFGVVFLISGVFSQMGILHTDPASQGDPKLWFPVLGDTLLILGIMLCAVSYRKEKACKLLLCEGTQTKGYVTSVRQLFFTRWGGLYPYLVYFTYEIEGLSYRGKSHLLWSQPKVCEQNTVTVYTDSQDPSHYAVDL